jgi:hypothetical protein
MKPFEVNRLLSTARERTGLADFGPDDYVPGLAAFIDSINAQGEISDDRRLHFEERVLRLLMNRLWFAKDLQEHPEIADEEVAPPVVIVSLPRTGSTKLHRMLGASGDFQSLLMWKAHMFARIPGSADHGKERRIQETRDYEKWMYEESPEIVTGHPMFTDEPEEDQLLGEFTFRDSYLFGLFNVPGYTQWLMQADRRPAMEYFYRQIQYLQWQARPQTAPWLLKSPIHLGSERHVAQAFKNPRFIVTHRDPGKCMPSISSPVRYMRKLYSDVDAAAALGDALTAHFAHKALEHTQWRESVPNAPVLDLSMREITVDGPGTARKVYDFLGMPLTPAAESAMRSWERDNQLEKHGRNLYAAEEIGTTEAAIRKAFAPYIERFAEFL